MAITPINVGTVANDGTGDPIRQAFEKVNANEAELDSRLTQAEADIGNLDKSDVGLGNVDNTADADKPVSTATQAALDQKVDESSLGVANGVATLDSGGKVPSAQLPSYVDDVLEFTDFAAFPATGEGGKIYVALDTDKTYRWSGSEYIYITSGAVDSVAGKTGVVTLVKADVGLGNVNNTSDTDKPVSTATQAALDTKVDKVTGKGLSTEDYTTAEQSKLAGVAEGATANSSDSYLLNSANHNYDPVDSDLPASASKTKGAIDILSFGVERLIRPADIPCILKTGADAVSVMAGTRVPVLGVKFDIDTTITMPTLTAGSDYSVWVHPDGTASAVADPFASPATAPVADAVKIGGFHYGLVAPATTVAGGSFATTGAGMIWTQGDVDRIAGINEYSIWDLTWRAKGEQHGFAFDPNAGIWAAIYFCGTQHETQGISRYNTNVASGTVLPRRPTAFGGNGSATYPQFNWWDASEIAASHGCRLLTYREFGHVAYGVTEAQSLGGASSTIPATARQPGFTSRIGLEQVTGHHYTWGEDASLRWDGANAGWNWRDVTTGRGSMYLYTDVAHTRVLLGGFRASAANSGSRASSWLNYPWHSNWPIGLRAASDHLNLGRAAR